MKKRIVRIAGLLLFVAVMTACGEDALLLDQDGVLSEMKATEETMMSDVEENESDAMQNDAEEVLYIHICGAVAEPGVYRVPAGSRIYDVVLMAGDFDEDADCEAVNLVQELVDGQQIRIPFYGELNDRAEDGLIDINTADEEELCQIPGIGESRAEAIVHYREEYGNFQNIEELMRVPGIKDGIYARISTYVECR